MRRIWPLAVAGIIGAAAGSGSMAVYLYNYGSAVKDNTQRIERLEKRPRPTCKPCAAHEHTTAPAKHPWWHLWR